MKRSCSDYQFSTLHGHAAVLDGSEVGHPKPSFPGCVTSLAESAKKSLFGLSIYEDATSATL
jgi:hypothetical protein